MMANMMRDEGQVKKAIIHMLKLSMVFLSFKFHKPQHRTEKSHEEEAMPIPEGAMLI